MSRYLESNVYVKALISSVIIVCIIRFNIKFYNLYKKGVPVFRTFLEQLLFPSTGST